MTFPSADDVARQFLLFKLGEALKRTDYEKLATPGDGWPEAFLDNEDVKFLERLGVKWSEQPSKNQIVFLLGDHFTNMNNHDVSLTLQREVQRQLSIVFVSLRK